MVLALSIITACIPYLKPFLEALETGMIRADGGAISRSQGFGYKKRYTSGYIKHGDSSKLSSKQSRSQVNNGVELNPLRVPDQKPLDGSPGTQTATVVGKPNEGDSDNDSQTSQSKIIRKTVGWSVTDEPQIALPPNTHLEYPSRSEQPVAFPRGYAC